MMILLLIAAALIGIDLLACGVMAIVAVIGGSILARRKEARK